jgi:hypothetical protein
VHAVAEARVEAREALVAIVMHGIHERHVDEGRVRERRRQMRVHDVVRLAVPEDLLDGPRRVVELDVRVRTSADEGESAVAKSVTSWPRATSPSASSATMSSVPPVTRRRDGHERHRDDGDPHASRR